MINGLGTLLAFADTNTSSNNNASSLNNYSNNDSFAKMLNNQSEEAYSQNYSNKTIAREEYNSNNIQNNYDDYNNYDKSNETSKPYKTIEEKLEEKIDNNSLENKKTENKDSEKISKENTENTESKINNNGNEEKELDDNASLKDKLQNNNDAKELKSNEKLAVTKQKARLLIAKETSKKNVLPNNEIKLSEKENIFNEIEKIKKQVNSINIDDLDKEEKKELYDLIDSLENLKAMLNNNDDKKVVAANEIINDKNNVEIKDIKDSELSEEIKILSNKESEREVRPLNQNNIKSLDTKEVLAENNDAANNTLADNVLAAEADNINIKDIDKRVSAKAENANSTTPLNNTISDDKGAELTVVNMKDSAEQAKGFNHYNNNVSKTHNSTNLSDSMLKFQDLMGKLVEKAQIAVSNNKSEVIMSLNPEYLGKVRLKISMEGDNLIGKIFVDNAEVKDIFSKNLDTVVSSLNEIGINIEGFDIMLKQDTPNGDFGEELENSHSNRLNFDDNENDAEEVKADIKQYIVPERKLNFLI